MVVKRGRVPEHSKLCNGIFSLGPDTVHRINRQKMCRTVDDCLWQQITGLQDLLGLVILCQCDAISSKLAR